LSSAGAALRMNVFWPAILLLLLLAEQLPAQSSSTRNQFWPELDAYVHINKRSRLFFEYNATRQDDLETYASGQVGGYFDFYTFPLQKTRPEHSDASRNRYLMLRIGYGFSRTPASSSKPSSTIHIPTIEADPRVPLAWKILLTDRSRFDLRIVDGVFTPRYRNRLRMERTFRQGRFGFTPYTDAEVFYDWKYGTFDIFRYTAGTEWSVGHSVLLETYYSRQRNTKSSPEYINALGMTLQFFLRNKARK
jgi:Protein of unknown function (DUF2490)